jgi:hypothetical protein
MSEFLDFLKHKYAYVAIGEFKPGCFGEAQQLFEKAVSTYSQGFKGAYLLQQPGTDRGIAIILWDHQEDMDANRSEAYESILKQMSPLFTKVPESSFYELCSEIQPKELVIQEN